MTAEFRAWSLCLAFSAIGCIQACATSGGAKAPEKQCTPEFAAELAAACFLRVKTECVDKGVPEAECKIIAECDAAADARLRECRK